MGYSADGARLIVASESGRQQSVSQPSTRPPAVCNPREFPGDRCGFHASQNRVSVRDKADLVFYDFATGNEVLRLQGFRRYGRAWSPDGRRLAAEVLSIPTRSQIVLWSLESGRRLVTLDSPPLD